MNVDTSGSSAAPQATVVYLRLRIQHDKSEPNRMADGRARLMPGSDYTVIISVTFEEIPRSQAFVLEDDAMYLSLSCRDWSDGPQFYSTEGTIGWDDRECRARLDRDHLVNMGGTCTIPVGLRLPEHTPQLETQLLLSCYQPSPSSVENRFSQPSIDIFLDGSGVAKQEAEELNFPPNIPVPANWAVLTVKDCDESSKHLELRGWHTKIRPCPFPRVKKPDPILADFVERKMQPDAVIDSIEEFAEDSLIADILHWFGEVRSSTPDDTVFVIVEHTESHIPWELLRLDQGEGYLGALSQVVRWTAVRFRLSLKSEIHGGTAVSFLDRKSLVHTQAEEAVLEQFPSIHLENKDELLSFLRQDPSSPIGLVYLGGHGKVTRDREGSRRYFSFRSLVDPSGPLTELNLVRMPKRDYEDLPVFLVNACHSGRLHRHGNILHGFPKKALSKFAKAFLGTLGEVDDAYASDIGVRILKALHDNPGGVYLADLLHRIRKEAATAFEEKSTETENQLRLIFSFMYVYYGNPLLQLRLRKGLPTQVSSICPATT